jgi:GNAT superfamily N-acetyltransferase
MNNEQTLQNCSEGNELHIRRATKEDAQAISQLILSLAHYFTLHPKGEGAEKFLSSISSSAITSYIEADNFMYFTGFLGDKLAGVAAIRDITHIFHLFVAEQFQRQGIARQLWTYARESAILEGNIRGFTVNSTPYALPVYEGFGFYATGPRAEKDGIAFIPMKMELERDRG